eukprot:74933_1
MSVVILTFIAIALRKQFTSATFLNPDECESTGFGLRLKHDCVCSSTCSDAWCHPLEFVSSKLSEPTTAPCPGDTVCCCSCPDCEGYLPPVCETEDAFNIAWLLDESGSVDLDEWNNVLSFVNRIHERDLPATSYSTLFEYASYAGFEHFLHWSPVEDENGDRSVFTQATESNHYNKGGLTYTWDAVNRVLDAFWDYRFSCDDGCEQRSDVLIVMTDGRPTDTVCDDIVPRLEQTDIDVIVIGVNMTQSQIDSISCLDVKDGGADMLIVSSYSEIDMESLELEVRNRVCTGDNLVGPGVRPLDGTQWVYENGEIGLGPVPTNPPGGREHKPGDT